jgi:hypothetical protein
MRSEIQLRKKPERRDFIVSLFLLVGISGIGA